MQLVRHLVSILLLPFSAVVLMPAWVLHRYPPGDSWPETGVSGIETIAARVAGAAIFALGLALFAWCVWLFGRVGKGTLAPWDPPRRFVAVGPYRYVRNPMISGVAAMLAGEAVFLASIPLALWTLTFVLVNQVYFVLSEEPHLERRYGPRYRAYKAAVPRWAPRFTPWEAP